MCELTGEVDDVALTLNYTTLFTWEVTTDLLLHIFGSHALRRKGDWTTKFGNTVSAKIRGTDNLHQ